MGNEFEKVNKIKGGDMKQKNEKELTGEGIRDILKNDSKNPCEFIPSKVDLSDLPLSVNKEKFSNPEEIEKMQDIVDGNIEFIKKMIMKDSFGVGEATKRRNWREGLDDEIRDYIDRNSKLRIVAFFPVLTRLQRMQFGIAKNNKSELKNKVDDLISQWPIESSDEYDKLTFEGKCEVVDKIDEIAIETIKMLCE